MDKMQLRTFQAMSLGAKVARTRNKIEEFYRHYDGKVYWSFSGGKDSTVLGHIIRGIYPDVPGVFCDTGLEYPEVREFVQGFDNVEWLRPAKTFKQVIEDHGYPVVSKKVSLMLYRITSPGQKSEKFRRQLMGEIMEDGRKSLYHIPEKWKKLIDAPFRCSDYCCAVMKKNPVKKYEKRTGRHPYIGMMAADSLGREQGYLATGCNAFDTGHPQSNPMGFWTEQDVLQYIREHRLKIADVYSEMQNGVRVFQREQEDGTWKLQGCDRTGCMFCMFGVHMEKGPENRFQRMKKTHPAQWRYCMDKLGMRAVLEYIGIPCE